MGNSYFQFKQFKIDQANAAMKVTTEGCLLGAFAKGGPEGSVLDIGSGTGLLALMLAQRTSGKITSVEPDPDAADQAKANANMSPWRERIQVVNDTIQHFAENCEHTFDLIVSNPPFYTNYLPSDDIRRKLAMHTYSLSMEDLAKAVGKLLSPSGLFYVLYPAYEAGIFVHYAQDEGLFPVENCIIRNKAEGPIFRMITSYGRSESVVNQTALIIRNEKEQYSDDFISLLKPYYLHL